MSRGSPTYIILGRYFPAVKELKVYLSDILQPSPAGTFSFIPNEDDTPAYNNLVNTSYVGLKTPVDSNSKRSRFQVFDVMANMHEVK